MIVIIMGDNGVGKSGLLYHLGNLAIFDDKRNGAMRSEISFMNANGFNLTIPRYAVASNVEMTFSRAFCFDRKPRIINPCRLGLQKDAPKDVKCHYTLPYETYLIDEAHDYFYSKAGVLPTYRTGFFQEHRHRDLNIYLATPSAMLIVKDIRQIASIWHVKSRDVYFNRKSKSYETRWIYHEIASGEGNYENYASAKDGEKSRYFVEKTIIAPYNVFNFYDCKSRNFKFVEGHLSDDFDLNYFDSKPITFSDFKEREENG